LVSFIFTSNGRETKNIGPLSASQLAFLYLHGHAPMPDRMKLWQQALGKHIETKHDWFINVSKAIVPFL
jgi:hypothetical protein